MDDLAEVISRDVQKLSNVTPWGKSHRYSSKFEAGQRARDRCLPEQGRAIWEPASFLTLLFSPRSSSSEGFGIAEKILLLSFISAVILMAILGNLLVMVAVCRDRQLRKIKTNYFIVSLAFADLLVSVLVMPFGAIELVQDNWVYGEMFCLVRTSLDVLLTTASILHLCCISLDRYYAICCQPLVYRNKMTPLRIAVMLGGCWVIPTFISFLPIMQGWNSIGIIDLIQQRQFNKASNSTYCIFMVNKPYAITCSVVAFYIPFLLMVLAYHRIYVTARAHARQIRLLQRAGNPAEPRQHLQEPRQHLQEPRQHLQEPRQNLQEPRQNLQEQHLQEPRQNLQEPRQHLQEPRQHLQEPRQHLQEPRQNLQEPRQNPPDQHSSHRMRTETKAAKTLCIIMGCFCLCWAPFFVTNIVDPFINYTVPGKLWTAFLWLGYINSGLNPFLYAFLNKAFRRAFLIILCCGDERYRRPSILGQSVPCSTTTINGSTHVLRSKVLHDGHHQEREKLPIHTDPESQESCFQSCFQSWASRGRTDPSRRSQGFTGSGTGKFIHRHRPGASCSELPAMCSGEPVEARSFPDFPVSPFAKTSVLSCFLHVNVATFLVKIYPRDATLSLENKIVLCHSV
ncbi:5-hydroxytryptamine receptor 4 [Cinclus cinclus]